MKRVVVILVCIILLATIGVVVLLRCVPQSRMTIRAIRPTGDFWYKPHPQPIWRFAVTNTGLVPVYWVAGVEVPEGSHTGYFGEAGGFIDWPESGVDTLAPGRGFETNMIVPAATGCNWRATILYNSEPTSFEETLSRWVDCIPGSWRLFRYRELHTYADDWRQTTNADIQLAEPK